MPWRPLQRAIAIRDEKRIEACIRDIKRIQPDVDEASVRASIDEELSLPVWKNLDYQVTVRRQLVGERDGRPVHAVHLSVRRLDRRPVRDWRDLQEIKNQLIGPDCEAVELFPAESRLVDTANQYHLWGFDDPCHRFPVGFDSGRIVDDACDPESGAVQRKRAMARGMLTGINL